jgi:hypothetical protein
MSDLQGDVSQDVSQRRYLLPAESSERPVF